MTPVFITGQDASTLAPLLKALASSGIPAAQALARDAQVTLSSWHQHVLSSGQSHPGRVWEQLAAELFVANIHHTQWAWADTQLIPLLNYWADFDSSIRFVLLAESPLSLALQQTPTGAPDEYTGLLQDWTQTHQALLHFALRHPERCLLLWGHQARQAPQALTQRIAQRWSLDLPAAPSTPPIEAHCPLATHLGEQLCQALPQAQQLLADLHACIEPLLLPAPAQAAPTLLGRYRQLLQLSQEGRQDSRRVQALQKELQAQTARASTAEQAHTSAEAQLKQAQEQIKQAQAKTTAAEQARTSAEAQLKQAQEQTKQAQAKTTAAEQARTSAEAQAKQTLAQRDTAEQAQQTAQAEVSRLQAETQSAQEEAELLLNQLHVVQEELENYYYRNKELQAQIEPLTQLKQRWNKLFQQQPELYAVESILIEPIPEQPDRVHCQLGQLDMAGRHFDTLDLQLQIHPDGCAVLHLPRPTEGMGALLRWPAEVKPGTALALHPSLAADTPPQTVAAYMQISSTDWSLVQDLHRLLLTALAQPMPALNPEQQHTLSAALQHSCAQLPSFGAILRFDSASCPTPPTEDILQLQLQHTSYQQQHAPDLTLQLQHQSENHFTLQISPNPLTGDTGLSLDITPTGWNSLQLAPLTEMQRHHLSLLLANLPMALMDAALNGADKNSLKPWAQTARQLREWTQPPLKTATPKATSSAPVKAAKSVKSAKATQRLPTKTKAPSTPTTPTPPKIAPPATPINIRAAKAKRGKLASVVASIAIASPVVTAPAPTSVRQQPLRRKARA